MLILQTFKPALGLRTPSPMTLKADALLAMSGLAYKRESADVRKAPRGKLPVLKIGERLLPDSSHIQTYLETEKGVDFDGHLTDEQRAVSVAVRRMLENHFYHIGAYYRWIKNPELTRDGLFGDIPSLPRKLIYKLVAGGVKKSLHLHGISRHTDDEILAFAAEDLRVLDTLLGDKPYFFGDDPSSLDAVAYGFLENSIGCTIETPLKAQILKHDKLVAFRDRFGSRYFEGNTA